MKRNRKITIMNRQVKLIFFLFVFTLFGVHETFSQSRIERLPERNEETPSSLEKKLFDNMATLYLNEDGVFKSGQGETVRVVTNIKRIDKLYSLNPIRDVEVVILNINNRNDIVASLDISKLKNYENLNYVLIQSSVEYSEDEFLNIIKTDPSLSEITVFYSVVIPN